MKNRSSIIALILIVALLIPSLALAADDAQSSVIITANTNLNLRSGPSASSSVVGYLPYGTSVPVLGRNNGSTWLLVEYAGSRGWVAAWLVSINGNLRTIPVSDEAGSGSSSTPAPTGVTTTPNTNLSLRAGPGTNYARSGVIPAGTTAAVLGKNADASWLYISYNGAEAWIAAWLATVNGDLGVVPVTSQAGTGSAPSTPSYSPGVGGGFELGGQTHTLANPDVMRSAGMTWVKIQIKWAPGSNPADTAGLIQNAHAQGFRILLAIPGNLYPSSIDFNAYVEYLRGIAAYGPDAIEIWNEQNLDREWPAGQINPASYVNNMLAPSYNAIKSVNPNIMVIAGALAPTGVHNVTTVWSDDIYLAGMRDAGAANYMDCIGVHHNAGASPPSQSYGHPADDGGGHYSWYFQPTFNLYSGTFPNTDVCFTEIGYLTSDGYGGLPPNFWWGGGTSLAEHAAWLGQAAQIAENSGRVRLFIVFNVDIFTYGDDPQGGYAIIRPGGACPACSTLAAVAN